MTVRRRHEPEVWDAGSSRAPSHAVRVELRVAARRSGLTAEVSRTAHPVGAGPAAVQRLVR